MSNSDDIRLSRIMDRYGCDTETAQNYLDLLEEGYTRYQARVMSGLIDPYAEEE